MAFVNKGLYTLKSDSGAKFAFTLFEGVTTDNGSLLGGNLIQSSLVGYSSGYTVNAMTTMTFNNGAVRLRKREGLYVDAQLVDSGGILQWGGNVSAVNKYDRCCPLAVYHYTDNDTWGLSGDSFQYEKRTSEIPPADTTKWTGVAVTPPSNGNAGYFSAIADNSVDSSNTGFITSQTHPQIVNLLSGAEPFITETDPYEQGGESDTGGGTGNFDGTSVDVDFTSLPTLSAVDTGFISLYNPTLAQLQSLANYMWSDLFDLDTFKKLFGDPMQAILGLSIVPGPVPSSGAQAVKVGNISTGISINKAASQYINIDCGTLNVEEFWGAYLDYEPYTKAEIFLPFIGVHQIAIDDIMNKSVHIKYHIDLLSGGCACEIKCGGSVLYTFIGSCAVSIPVTGSDWTNLLNGVLSAATAIGTMVATGGASAPAAASTIASAAVNSLKPSIEKSGSIAGAGGLLAGKVPVLILTRPRQALPGRQNKFTGYPAFITRSLGALSGYTEVHSIRLSGIDGTESEIDEIEELLKGGVIL